MLKNKDIMEVCQILAKQENLRVTVNEVGKSALAVGVGAALGGLLGGPRGLAIGGALASVIVGVNDIGRYRSVVDILKNDLTPAQRNKLVAAVKRVLGNISAGDVVSLLLLLTGTSLKDAIIQEIALFLLKEMSLTMIR